MNPQVHLYVETMDSVLVEYAPDGRVRLENEDWRRPTLQETRAIILLRLAGPHPRSRGSTRYARSPQPQALTRRGSGAKSFRR